MYHVNRFVNLTYIERDDWTLRMCAHLSGVFRKWDSASEHKGNAQIGLIFTR
jgi:hypothetical protein